VNTVEIKTAELVALASKYGITSKIEKVSDSYIVISYASKNLTTKVSITEAGNATVKTWERKHVIANSSFESKLASYKAIADRKVGVAA
jgi:hypothetical protein